MADDLTKGSYVAFMTRLKLDNPGFNEALWPAVELGEPTPLIDGNRNTQITLIPMDVPWLTPSAGITLTYNRVNVGNLDQIEYTPIKIPLNGFLLDYTDSISDVIGMKFTIDDVLPTQVIETGEDVPYRTLDITVRESSLAYTGTHVLRIHKPVQFSTLFSTPYLSGF